jgi:cyclophilin family peptidyl-prolyl cis-trans isomerase
MWFNTMKTGVMAAALCMLGLAQAADVKPTVTDLLKASATSDWRDLDPDNTLYLNLEKGRVVIELAPDFAPLHVGNIKKLVREHYFDGLAIIRSQDNYVAQWGDPDEAREIRTAAKTLPPEFSVAYDKQQEFTRLPDADGYAPEVGFAHGFPAARSPANRQQWLTHCYGMLGVGRDVDENSGSGAELYVVTGHAPRHLDRNISLAGRVVQGMEWLSTLPRGHGPLGFYEKPEQYVKINSVVVAADLPPEQRMALQVIRTDTPLFQAMIEAQRNRGGDWYKVAAGYIELCNVALPVRVKPDAGQP